MSTPAAIQIEGLERFERYEHAAMATAFVFYLRSDDDPAVVRPAALEATRLIDQVEDRLSFYREGSEVSRINRAREGEVLRISEDTLICLLTALQVSAASGGAFDPFAGGPSLAAKRQPVPSHLVDRPADDPAGTACLAVDPAAGTVTKLAGRRWLDLGAVGKGHALDAAAALLQEWGVTAGLLVAGGSSVYAFGPGPGPEGAWPLTVVSGDGERSLQLLAPFALGASGEGFQPGHLIRPSTRTPLPASPPARRSYALAATAALADALSTALWLVDAGQRAAVTAPWPESAYLIESPSPSIPAEATGPFAAHQPRVPECWLVIPCWREARRLPHYLPRLCAALTASGLPVEVQVSDDGSPPDEAAATAAFVESLRPRFPCLRPLVGLDEHAGKGAAILHGWAQAPAGTRWLAFVDADGSVPPADMVGLLREASERPTADVVFAPTRRHGDPAHPVRRRRRRALVGSAFARWSRWRLGHAAQDPQCGCKLVPAALVRSRPWSERGYALDLELLVAARADGLEVLNRPISWIDQPASRLRVKDLFKMLQTIERLRITARASSGPAPASPSSTP